MRRYFEMKYNSLQPPLSFSFFPRRVLLPRKEHASCGRRKYGASRNSKDPSACMKPKIICTRTYTTHQAGNCVIFCMLFVNCRRLNSPKRSVDALPALETLHNDLGYTMNIILSHHVLPLAAFAMLTVISFLIFGCCCGGRGRDDRVDDAELMVLPGTVRGPGLAEEDDDDASAANSSRHEPLRGQGRPRRTLLPAWIFRIAGSGLYPRV